MSQAGSEEVSVAPVAGMTQVVSYGDRQASQAGSERCVTPVAVMTQVDPYTDR